VASKHVYEIYVRTTPEALWEALTDPERTERYWSGRRVESTWQPGASVRFVFEGEASTHGEIVEAVPPRRLVMTWNRTFDDGVTEGPSRVTWEIEPLGETCRLRLVHDDFHGTTRVFAMVGRGWPIVLSSLKTLLETDDVLALAVPDGEPVDDTTDIDKLDHREWAINANQRVWALLADGAPSDEAARRELVDAAHASQWHWSYAGDELNRQRGEWLISHVYAVLGDGPAALRHALRCWEITEAEGLKDFDYAYGCEGLARAYAVAGDSAAATEWRERAAKAGALIADSEDREIFESDLASA
jgi:uncharacterized protein YndB with AHSA1/START domain